ncbi:MAG: 3-keto-5-aminohexanoate cleavage protein, partial [Mesorhizobium sp.]
AAACLEAGAAMIHAHVRDRDGRHLLDAHAYRETTKAIRDAVGERLIIQITSEAVGRYQPAEQMAVVRAT